MRSDMEKAAGGQKAEDGGILDHGLYWVSPGWARQGKADTRGLVSLNSFRGLWALVVVSHRLAPGPDIIKAEASCLLGCRGQIEGSGSVSLLICPALRCL